MLKHLGISILAAVIIIIGIVPLIDGMIFKIKYHDFISTLNNEYRIHADILEYHEGWFNSTAKLKITIHDNHSDLGKMMSKYIYFINAKISHGPIVYHGIENKIALGYANIHSVLHILEVGSQKKSTGLTKLDTLARFNGNWRCQIHVSPLQIALPNAGQVAWDGLTAELIFKLEKNIIEHLAIKAQIGKFNYASNTPNPLIKTISAQPLLYQSDTDHDKMGLWSGNAVFTIPKIVMEGANNSLMQIENSNMNSQYGLTPDICYNSNFAINISTFTLPFVLIPSMTDVHLKLTASNFKINSLIDYMLLLVTSTQAALKDLNIAALQNLTLQTLMTNSIITGDLWSKTSIGNFDSHTEVTLPPDLALPDNTTELTSNLQIVSNVKGTYNFVINIIKFYRENIIATIIKHIKEKQLGSLPNVAAPTPAQTKPNAESPEEIFTKMLHTSYIRQEGNLYTTVFSVKGGVIRMNAWEVGRLITPPTAVKTP